MGAILVDLWRAKYSNCKKGCQLKLLKPQYNQTVSLLLEVRNRRFRASLSPRATEKGGVKRDINPVRKRFEFSYGVPSLVLVLSGIQFCYIDAAKTHNFGLYKRLSFSGLKNKGTAPKRVRDNLVGLKLKGCTCKLP